MRGTVNAFVKVLRSQVGTLEGPNNTQKYGVWDHMPNSAWCGQFVSWCLTKAGVPGDWDGNASQRYTPDAVGYWRDNHRFYQNPKVGDIIFFDWAGGDWVDHVGAVIETADWKSHGIVTTIEGNTGSPQGVHIRQRHKKDIVGFGRPRFRKRKGLGKKIILRNAPRLSIGSRGRGVRVVQKILDITVDGDFGKETLGAVKAFQRSVGLTPDGVVGDKTKAALLKS